jgi:hypothetical protein
VIVMPDGHMQSWGPYGKIQNCIRPNDDVDVWVDFLNADPLAQQLWCLGFQGYQNQFAIVPPEAFVDEVSRRIGMSCQN